MRCYWIGVCMVARIRAGGFPVDRRETPHLNRATTLLVFKRLSWPCEKNSLCENCGAIDRFASRFSKF
jgi:hypothetical protein